MRQGRPYAHQAECTASALKLRGRIWSGTMLRNPASVNRQIARYRQPNTTCGCDGQTQTAILRPQTRRVLAKNRLAEPPFDVDDRRESNALELRLGAFKMLRSSLRPSKNCRREQDHRVSKQGSSMQSAWALSTEALRVIWA